MRRVVLLAGVAVVLAAGAPVAASQDESRRGYIVVFKDSVALPRLVAQQHASKHDARVAHVYTHALEGYAASISDAGLRAVSADPRVAYVERDARVTASVTTQSNVTWGLDRIDQRSGRSGTFTYTNAGAGVTAYILDTGIRISHSDFGGRATSGYDAVDGGSADDCNGHGTHVAGTVGGASHGVAKGVKLVAVRVLDCGGAGSASGVIAGVDWVTGNHAAGAPAVANMSLRASANSALDDAVRGSISDGVSYSVAAGNGNAGGVGQDACKYSPARVGPAITTSATNKSDYRTSWANFGKCVDWFAPGAGVTSAWHSGDSDTNTISGTSMAAPHTAGVAALYLQGSPGASPSTVRDVLYGLATKGVVKSSKTANNHLLFTNL